MVSVTRPPTRIILTRDLWDQMQAEAQISAPLEACGLVAGVGEQARAVIRMSNALKSPVRYRLDPQEQLNAFTYIEENGWELLGIFHSHPTGPATPSPTDIEEATYPEVVYLIWSLKNHSWQCRGFSIQDRKVSEIQLVVTN